MRRTASGRAAHGARLVSGLGSPEGAGIADDGSSRVAWASDLDSAGEPSLYVARISAAGELGVRVVGEDAGVVPDVVEVALLVLVLLGLTE